MALVRVGADRSFSRLCVALLESREEVIRVAATKECPDWVLKQAGEWYSQGRSKERCLEMYSTSLAASQGLIGTNPEGEYQPRVLRPGRQALKLSDAAIVRYRLVE